MSEHLVVTASDGSKHYYPMSCRLFRRDDWVTVTDASKVEVACFFRPIYWDIEA